MLIALHNGRRIPAHMVGSGALGSCPWTGKEVKAHVGQIRQYWAYVGGAPEFPRGYEPESDWHLSWKALVEDANCEVVLGEQNEHRADILGAGNTVVEIQRSRIDIRDSTDRVRFYNAATGRRVIWVVDIQEFWRKTFELSGSADKSGHYKVRWSPKRTWLWDLAATTDTNVFLEYRQNSDKLLNSWVHRGIMYVKFLTKEDFFYRYLEGVARPEYRGFPEQAFRVLQGVI